MLTMDNIETEKVEMRISGSMTIPSIPEMYVKLKELLDMGKNVEIVLEDVSDADISFLQLLCSAHRSFNEKDLMLTVTGKKNELLDMKHLTGFTRHMGCSRDKFKNCILVKEK